MENKPALLIVQLIPTRNVTARSDYQKLGLRKEKVEKWVAGFTKCCSKCDPLGRGLGFESEHQCPNKNQA